MKNLMYAVATAIAVATGTITTSIVVPSLTAEVSAQCPKAQPQAVKNWDSVQKGMTSTQVQSKLGKPVYSVVTAGKDLIWTFNLNNCTAGAVVFRNDKLIDKAKRNG